VRLAVVAAKLMAIAATFVHSRQMLHPHALCFHFRFHHCRGLRTNSRPASRRPAPRGPLHRSTADAVGRRGPGDFVKDRVIVHPSCRLIGTYRSLPTCNRFAFLRLVRLLTVLIIAAAAMYQTKSLVTNETIERSACMNIAPTVVALSAFTWVLSIAPSARSLRKRPG